MASHSSLKKDSLYWNYWEELVKASVYRQSREIPAIADAAQINGKNSIDAGCGPGRLILPFSKMAKTITAVDENDWAISSVEKIIKENRLDNVQVAQSPLVSLPFDDGVSESTYCIWVIHHAKKRWEKIVRELVRVTRSGSPVVVGFASGQKDLPRLEDVVKKGHLSSAQSFDHSFPAWCKEESLSVSLHTVPLSFEFNSPEWALEVFSNTFFPRHIEKESLDAASHFLQQHVRNKKCIIEQELILYTLKEQSD
ncbi:MAG: class I SAM-dependent methyltransferase [Candidatus Diapherotrites archaeon]